MKASSPPPGFSFSGAVPIPYSGLRGRASVCSLKGETDGRASVCSLKGETVGNDKSTPDLAAFTGAGERWEGLCSGR